MASTHEMVAFPEEAEEWFAQGEALSDKVTAGEMPAELEGDYLDPPGWRSRLRAPTVVVGCALACALSVLWVLG